jgi:hypothetical protein
LVAVVSLAIAGMAWYYSNSKLAEQSRNRAKHWDRFMALQVQPVGTEMLEFCLENKQTMSELLGLELQTRGSAITASFSADPSGFNMDKWKAETDMLTAEYDRKFKLLNTVCDSTIAMMRTKMPNLNLREAGSRFSDGTFWGEIKGFFYEYLHPRNILVQLALLLLFAGFVIRLARWIIERKAEHLSFAFGILAMMFVILIGSYMWEAKYPDAVLVAAPSSPVFTDPPARRATKDPLKQGIVELKYLGPDRMINTGYLVNRRVLVTITGYDIVNQAGINPNTGLPVYYPTCNSAGCVTPQLIPGAGTTLRANTCRHMAVIGKVGHRSPDLLDIGTHATVEVPPSGPDMLYLSINQYVDDAAWAKMKEGGKFYYQITELE